MQITKVIDDRTPLQKYRRTQLVYHIRNSGIDVEDNLPARTYHSIIESNNLGMPTPETLVRKDSFKEEQVIKDELAAKENLDNALANRKSIDQLRYEAAQKQIDEEKSNPTPKLEELKRHELIKLAKANGVEVSMKMKNVELIEAIRNV